jgi:hypothetical protein
LAFAASQPAHHFSYVQSPTNYAYSAYTQGPQQFYAQQIPFQQFAYNPDQPINPVLHAAPVATFANSFQTPANTYYVSPQQIQKYPIYNQQPQGFSLQSYMPSNYHHQHQNQKHVTHLPSPLPSPSRIITSKPVALQSPLQPPTSSTSSSHVEHNHGAVSYSQFSHSGEEKPSATPLIATQTPQQVYYHQQPQPIYSSGDYGKQQFQYAALPIAPSNYYPTQGGGVHYGNVSPYAHISKVPFAPPTSASTLIPSIANIPQKVAFH